MAVKCVTAADSRVLDQENFKRRTRVITELKACGNSKNLEWGRTIHEAALQTGDSSNAFVASMLIGMYVKCGRMEDACQVFDNVKDPDVVCWTALILGYADNGKGWTALDLFWRMRQECCDAPDARTFVAVLKACVALAHKEEGNESSRRAKGLHLLALIGGCDNMYVKAILVDMYAKCCNMANARKVFDSMRKPDVVSWTALVLGYADNGEGDVALDLFSRMKDEGSTANARTFVGAVMACIELATKDETNVRSKERGKAVHVLASASGWDSDVYVLVTLVDMYAKCSSMEEARKVFDSMKHPCVVCWNALILGYADNGKDELALTLLSRMRREGCSPNERTFVAVLKACIHLGVEERKSRCVEIAKSIHLLASSYGFDSDMYVENTLVDMYSKFRSMVDARKIFEKSKNNGMVSWNTLMSGYVENGEGAVVLELFGLLKRPPDVFTFSTVLRACSILGASEFGKEIHAEISSRGLESDPVLATCLVDFYAKCGNLYEAEKIFMVHASTQMVSWNVLMTGYSCHGNSKAVFDLFQKMQDCGLQPDCITFNVVLTTCGQAGLVDKGKEIFEAMLTRFKIDPNAEHYTCVIDMLGRAKKLDDAMVFARSMPFRPRSVTWMTVLGACRIWKNVELGKLVFETVTSLDHGDSGPYIAMANIYGSRGMWADEARLQDMRMKLCPQDRV